MGQSCRFNEALANSARVTVDGGDLIAVLSTAKLTCHRDQRSYCTPEKGSVASEYGASEIASSVRLVIRFGRVRTEKSIEILQRVERKA